MIAPRHRVLALARIELLTALRDRTGLAMFAFTLAAGLAAPPGTRWLGSVAREDVAERAQTQGDAELATCPDAGRAPVAVAGPWPAWAAWPDPFVPAVEGVVRVAVTEPEHGPLAFVLSGGDAAARDQVEACLLQVVGQRRRERLAELGVAHDPDETLSVTIRGYEAPPKPRDLRALISPVGALLATYGLVLAGGIAIEAVPRRRASGLLEQLKSTQTRSTDLVAAWLLAIGGLTLAHFALLVASCLGSAAYLGIDPGALSGVAHAVVFALGVAAASVRTSLHAVDVQAASLRWFAVLFALIGTGGLAGWWAASAPWAAALVPLGGSLVAATGVLGPWGWLADLVGLAVVALLVLDCGRSLDAEDSSAAGADPALARRARGRWGPEAFVLAAMGLATSVAAGGGGDQPWLGITVAFVLFMLLPALLAGPVLGVPVGELLPLRRPVLRDLALAVPIAVGLLALGQPILALTASVLPENALTRQFVLGLTDLADSPFGAVAIAVYPALCEELLYRGAILGLLLRSGRPWVAIAGQALAFSLAHVISVRLPWTFVLGLFLGWLRVRTGSLWTGIAVHFLINGAAVTWLWLAPGAEASPAWWGPLLVGLAALAFVSRREISEAPADGEPR